jgi:hypothetical protein
MYQGTSGGINRIAIAKTDNIKGSLDISGDLYVTGSVYVSSTLYASAKSFLIDHPTKSGYKLKHGVAESPEHSVFVRGRLTNSNIIILPDYWCSLVDNNSITVQLTPIGRFQKLYVSNVDCNNIQISNNEGSLVDCYYFVQAERKDVPKLIVEIKNNI